MTSASSLAYPGSRTLATWWRQLAPFKPQGLWVGYLFLHYLEALASWQEPQPLDPLLLLVLEALRLERHDPLPLDSLCRRVQERLSLHPPIVCRLVRCLAERHLLRSQVGPSGEPLCTLTEEGLAALQSKQALVSRQERAAFPFVERLGPSGQRLAAPHFVRVSEIGSTPWTSEGHAFDASLLHACLEEGPLWKKTFGFPLGVTAFPDAVSEAGASGACAHAIVDRTERALVVLFLGPKPQEELLGFGVRPEGWILQTAKPIVHLPAEAAVVFWGPEDRTLERWRPAWLSWCAARNLSMSQAEECALSLLEERLLVTAPERLVQSLRLGKSDIFKGDAWLLAGDGYLRPAARLELATT